MVSISFYLSINYPKDDRTPTKPGKLRLVYEAAPMAFLVEQAGGLALSGTTRIMTISPHDIHQRVEVILGSAEEVWVCEYYLTSHT